MYRLPDASVASPYGTETRTGPDGKPFPALDVTTSFPYHPVFDTPADATVKVPAWLNDRTLYHNRGDGTFLPENHTQAQLIRQPGNTYVIEYADGQPATGKLRGFQGMIILRHVCGTDQEKNTFLGCHSLVDGSSSINATSSPAMLMPRTRLIAARATAKNS